MIRIDLDEQTAVELHHAVGVMREILERSADHSVATAAMRDAQLALAGGLRAHGWTPTDDGWAKRPTRPRR